MNTDLIVEKYKKYCTKLKSAEMMLLKDIESVRELERFINDGVVNPDDVIKAFKKANKSNFLTGKVKDFQADIRWMCNPVNIDKVNSGKYDNNSRSKRSLEQKPQSHNYKFDEIEKNSTRRIWQSWKKLEKTKTTKSGWKNIGIKNTQI